ncbi:PP2C family serine/threonine-protein phosphatase [Actinomycetospora rhizophila]|uniref:PP2C family serine/threonine-protein phosphatase n=1 Tax=Actinomycetospora rhizophila TaxID=1416876 RepID=A0ABV9ZM56_9PSEU
MSPAGLHVISAELPAGDAPNEDRVRIGKNAVVVLDGASGSDTRVTVADYVDHLAGALIEVLDAEQDIPLPHALADAIRSTVATLRLMPGESPSSTVSIARRRGDEIDLLVLGDSPIYLGPDGELLTDDQLARLDLPSRTKAYGRLRQGTGYDEVHRDLVRAVRAEQLPLLNEPGGYWIAEARPEAGHQAVTRTVPADLPWLVMLTDGVDRPLGHLGVPLADVVRRTRDELEDLLQELHEWEEDKDPAAHELPRFKQHDDKTIALALP